MTLRVVQINCVIDAAGRPPEALLTAWPTMPLVATAVARAGAAVTVLCASRTDGTHLQDGVTYRCIPEPRVRDGDRAGLMPWRLAAAARALRPDVIHFNGLGFPLHLRAACALDAPVLVQDHKSQPGERWLRLRRWSFGRIAGIAFTSSEQAEPFVKAGLLRPRTPVFEVAESSCTFVPGDRAEARRISGVHGNPALLWVGHLNANKDPLTILEAVRRVLPQLPDLQLWCAFDSVALLPAVERLLRADAQLAARVHLLGRVSHAEVETLCRACDVFVLGSRHEGSGYALLEALACGLPPVVSDIPPFRSLTGNGAVGALAPVGDAAAFAAGIVRMANTPRHEARAAVLAHFTHNLSPDALGHKLLSVYERLAQGAAVQ